MEKQTRMEAALYWSAVSLIVCEGLPIDKAAEQLGVAGADLHDILHRRQSLRLIDEHGDEPAREQSDSEVVVLARH
ncbi:hypothetical protein [Povalibacter sp.]|uniref:hypothetical protein n=1 Tax=Povalibacter sp. TaxID=1962978 RepID=UPI002F408C14